MASHALGRVDMEYGTGQVARLMGVHPNTVRLYEKAGLIAPARRLENGYRRFDDEHVVQFAIARCAFRAEILQNGLRKDAANIAYASGACDYAKARELCRCYIEKLVREMRKADEAVHIAERALAAAPANSPSHGRLLKRKEAALELGISIDVLRNWEANGLLSVKRAENGYRMYAPEDMDRLRIVRALRCANYSIASILRLMRALDEGGRTDVRGLLDGREHPDDVVRACDHLCDALVSAKRDAEEILVLIGKAHALAVGKMRAQTLH